MCASNSLITTAISTATGLIGVGIGAWISRNTAFKIIDRQERKKAFIALEASFIPVKLIIEKPNKTGDDWHRIPTYFESQTIARMAFVGHLQGESKRIFEEKWHKYNQWHQEYEALEAEKPLLGALRIPKQINEISKMIDEILDAAKK